ncbi:hypothetical protein Ocin01_15619 [Orchesella cincta]|uniref:CARD domain-containing protein n=1 Tax=Orchesella cincta TaxID=48709 RepID=A0A1D2MDX4_ORCCI|nr:hypothetical protein Ocin01_15619 [Orchesella cincta]
MEETGKEWILENFSVLLKLTDCNTSFLAILLEKNVLSDEDIQQIKAQNTTYGMAWEVYNKLFARVGSYAVLLHALQETNQTGAVEILNQIHQKSSKRRKNDHDYPLDEIWTKIHPSCLHDYEACINNYHFEMEQVLCRKIISKEKGDLSEDHNRILGDILTRFEKMCDRNPTTQFSPRQIVESKWRLEQALGPLKLEYERKWTENWKLGLESMYLYLDIYKLGIRQQQKTLLLESGKLEIGILDYMENVKSAKDEFRRKFKNLSEDFLNSCLDEMESYASTKLVDVFKLLRRFPFPDAMISHDTVRDPTVVAVT